MNIHEFIINTGEVVYGEKFVPYIARDLDVSERTLRRWLSGNHPVPDNIEYELLTLLRLKSQQFMALYDTHKETMMNQKSKENPE